MTFVPQYDHLGKVLSVLFTFFDISASNSRIGRTGGAFLRITVSFFFLIFLFIHLFIANRNEVRNKIDGKGLMHRCYVML